MRSILIARSTLNGRIRGFQRNRKARAVLCTVHEVIPTSSVLELQVASSKHVLL
jgi:hypothetical protein